jgi:hypothetical protein
MTSIPITFPPFAVDGFDGMASKTVKYRIQTGG